MEGSHDTRKFFEDLCSLKDDGGQIRAPDKIGYLPVFLSDKFPLKSTDYILQKLIELELLGYIQIERSINDLISIQIKIDKWDPERTLLSESAHKYPEEKRRFVILIDYKNLEDGIKDPTERFKDFSWLLDPILKKGIIEFAFVFIPEQLSGRPAIMQLFHKHGFSPILCPRQIEGVITKDKDTVDSRMIDIGMSFIEHSDITDLVIVSGDADFQRLVTFALWRQKSVRIVSAERALSKTLLDMEGQGQKLEIQIV